MVRGRRACAVLINKQEATRSHHFTAIRWCWSAVSHPDWAKTILANPCSSCIIWRGSSAEFIRTKSHVLWNIAPFLTKKLLFGHNKKLSPKPLESTKANGWCRKTLILDAIQDRSSAIILCAQRPGVTAPKTDRLSRWSCHPLDST